MAKKELNAFLEDDDNPVMSFLNNAEAAGGNTEETEVRKRAKEINVSEFTQIPELRDIFQRDNNIMEYITEQIKQGYDPAEPIVYWQHDGEKIVVDGNTRFECTKRAGKLKILAIEKEFDDLEQAIAYAKHRQVRRNLSDQQVYMIANIKLENVRGTGRDVEKKAEMTGLSPSTIQHAKTIENKATEEVKAAVKKGEMSINEAYNTVNPPKNKKQKEEKDEELSDALEDNSGNPQGLSGWDHTDGIERPDYHNVEDPDNETDKIVILRRESYEEGEKNGYDKGLKKGCEIAEKLFYFALGEINKGRSIKEVLEDERVSDFSAPVLINFELPVEDENGGI